MVIFLALALIGLALLPATEHSEHRVSVMHNYEFKVAVKQPLFDSL